MDLTLVSQWLAEHLPAWVTGNLSLPGVFWVWVALTLLGTTADAAEAVVAASPSKSDDESLASLKAKPVAKIILSLVKPFSLVKHLTK